MKARGMALALMMALAPAAPAGAQDAPRQTFADTFTTTAPGASTGLRLEIDYHDPENPEGKPYAVQTILQTLHPGTRIDTSVPPRCEASDQELMAQGAGACPAETRVGGGELSVDTGSDVPGPRVVESRVTFFNADGEVILFTESTNTQGAPIRTSGRSRIGDGTITSTVPPVPAAPPPDPFLAIKRVRVALDAFERAGGAFITTPPECPAGGAWTHAGTFTYRDGIEQTVTSDSPCSAAAQGAGPTCRPGWLGVARPPASAARLNRRASIGVVLIVVGAMRDVRVRLTSRRTGATVAVAAARRVAGHTSLRLRARGRATAGPHRVSVTATDRCGRAVRAARGVRLRR